MGKTTLFLGGEIFSANARDELAEAMLIEDERILLVGDREDALALSDSDTEIVDLEKRALIPGFINTYPTNPFGKETGISPLEARARELLSLGWSALRLTPDCLRDLRKLVSVGRLTKANAPCLFSLYERAEMISESCRLLFLLQDLLSSESSARRAEWAIADRRPIAFEASGEAELHSVREFLRSLSAQSAACPGSRLYLGSAPSREHLPFLLSHRMLPIFLCRDRGSAASLEAFREHGLSAIMAEPETISPLLMLSLALTPLGDDYRRVPPLLSVLSLHAAELESVASELGSLEWGKRADFLILSSPLLGCPPSRLPLLSVAESWVGGRRLALAPVAACVASQK